MKIHVHCGHFANLVHFGEEETMIPSKACLILYSFFLYLVTKTGLYL